jgi:hypothetical protein
MVDWKKGYEIAKMPVLAIIAIAVVVGLVSIVPALNMLICILGLPVFILNIVLYAYIGYLISKAGMELADSAVTGALAALAAGVVGLVINLVALPLGFGVGLDAVAVIAASVVGIITGMVIAAIIAVVGHLIGGATAKKGGAAPAAKAKK